MRQNYVCTLVVLLCVSSVAGLAQVREESRTTASVPRLINFSGAVKDASVLAPSVVSLIFSLYNQPDGGSPVWAESQTVPLDEQGRYTVLLGAASRDGMPLETFSIGKSLWLGVQPQISGAAEQPRLLLVAVPYALKAADADTLGGKPASSYMLAGSGPGVTEVAVPVALPAPAANLAGSASGPESPLLKSPDPRTACASVTSDGTAAATEVAIYSGACALTEDTKFVDVGGKVGIGTSTPAYALDVQSTSTATSGTLHGQQTFATFNPSASSSATGVGNFVQAGTSSGNINNLNFIASLEFLTYHTGTGTVSTMEGMQGKVYNEGTGKVMTAEGIYAEIRNTSTGTINNGYGVYVDSPLNTGGGTFNTYYGLYLANPTGAATNYALYSAGGTNYFAGNVGIGTTTPAAALEVAGGVLKASGGIMYGDGTLQTTKISANLAAIATLRWYTGSVTYTVGSNPIGVAFDGANIWVTGTPGGKVTELRASDGSNLGSFSAGTSPYGVAFDGANIWVTNDVSSGTVTELRASDGTNLGTFNVGNSPLGVAFDGANIWVANSGSNNVTKLRASDGGCVGTCTFSVGTKPYGVAFDGANIWVANSGSSSATKLRASDGGCVGTCTFSVGSSPFGVAFDGANIWVANNGDFTVTKLRASDGACVGTCTFNVGRFPYGVAFDGANIWVTDNGVSNVTVILPAAQ